MSQNIHEALDNLEAQLAAIVGRLDPGVAGNLIEAIADNVDAVRVAIETQSTAEIVAQNTNFLDLIAALNALQLICCPPSVYVNIGGMPTADIAPSDDGTEFQSAPPPFQLTDEAPGSSEYYSRKCKMAWAIHTDVRNYIQVLNDNGVDDMSGVAAVVITTALGIALGELVTPVPILDGASGGVIGFLAGLGLVIFRSLGQLEFGLIVTAMDNNQADLVCALYEAPDTTTAIFDYLQVLENAGLSEPNKAVVAAMLTGDIVNYLYFQNEEQVEVALDEYTPPGDCSGCIVNCPAFRVIYGTQVGQVGNQYTIDSQFLNSNPDGHWVSVHFGQDDGGGTCGPAMDVKIISINQPSVTDKKAYRMSQTHFMGGTGAPHPNWTEFDDDWSNHINVQKTGVRTFTLFKVGTTPFQVVLEIT